MRFLIPTIFLSLGFIVSCNDEIASVGEEEPSVNKNTPTTVETPSVSDPPTSTSTPTITSSSTPKTTETPVDIPTTSTSTPTTTSSNSGDSDQNDDTDMDINPVDLSKEIEEIGEKIEKLEKESSKHYKEYYQMVDVQKEILSEIKRRKMIMRSKPLGSNEQIQAQKDFEDQKKYGKERLEVLKEKNILLNKFSKSILEAKDEKKALQKKQENFLKRQKEKAEKN